MRIKRDAFSNISGYMWTRPDSAMLLPFHCFMSVNQGVHGRPRPSFPSINLSLYYVLSNVPTFENLQDQKFLMEK